jgi:hypothetical protein
MNRGSSAANRGGAGVSDRAAGAGNRGGAGVSDRATGAGNRGNVGDRGGGNRDGIGSGDRDGIGSGDRGDRNVDRGDRNTNINNNQNINVDVDDGWGGDWDHHPIAAGVAFGTAAAFTAAAIGSVYYSLPPGCSPYAYGSMSYYGCGGYWYQPQYVGTSVQYTVVEAPPGAPAAPPSTAAAPPPPPPN